MADHPADDLLVMDLANGGRVVIQLAPDFAPVHVANIRALARANYWNGATVYRVQDNYVAQWGLNESDKPWPAGVDRPSRRRNICGRSKGLAVKPLGSPDAYAPGAGFADGWPVAYSPKAGWADLVHCYGSVGVGRDLSPDTGTGGELYAVIGQAPRQLDRNIAVVGRVIDGHRQAELASARDRGARLLQGQGAIRADRRASASRATCRRASGRPIEYMDTASPTFARYLKVRANRHDDFYIRPAGGVDLCNVQVPVRKKA